MTESYLPQNDKVKSTALLRNISEGITLTFSDKILASGSS